MFVGDSLGQNQWVSLACMLHVSLPQAKYSMDKIGKIYTFTLLVSYILFSNLSFIILQYDIFFRLSIH